MKKLPFLSTLGTTLKGSFKELYSAMGFSFLTGVIWFIAYVPIIYLGIRCLLFDPQGIKGLNLKEYYASYMWLFPFMVSFAGVVIWNAFFAGPVMTALYSLYQERKTDYPGIKLFFRLWRKFYWRSASIHLVYTLVLFIIVINILIGLTQSNILLTLAGVISLYIMFFCLLLPFFFHPLIYLGNSFKKVLRKSFLLVLDNTWITLGFNLALGLCFILSIVIPILLVIIYGGLVLYVIDRGFEVIYNKYDG